MQSSEQGPSVPAVVPPIAAGDAGPSAVGAGGNSRRLVLTLSAGLVAGLLAWIIGEACLGMIKPPLHPMNSRGVTLKVTFPREEATADAQNAGLAFVVLGATLGSGLGLAGGLVRRSRRAMLTAGLLGLALGVTAAALASLALLPAYNAYKARNADEALRDLLTPLLVHGAIWSSIGAAAGLAYGFGLGARSRWLVIAQTAIAGAALATVLYELVGALAFPAAETARFVSTTWQTRLFARLSVALLAAAGAALAAPAPPPKNQTIAPEAT
jgi:hypothetical protein